MYLKILIITLLSTCIFAKINLNPLEEDTTVPMKGRVCAFADMNKDQYTDVIVIGDDRTISIMLQSPKENLRFNEYQSLGKIQLNRTIENVYCAVADFNGDSLPDIMVTQGDSNNYVNSAIYIQSGSEWQILDLKTNFTSQPTVLDINGDGVGDVVGFDEDSNFYCQKGGWNGFSECKDMFDKRLSENKSFKPHKNFSTIFADIDKDLSAEIIFGVEENGRLKLEVYSLGRIHDKDGHIWQFNQNLTGRLDIPDKCNDSQIENLSIPVVADFNADGSIDILMAECNDKDCKQISKFLMWTIENNWTCIPFEMKDIEFHHASSDLLFRVGDFTLDGFPDLIATVSNKEGRAMPVILENIEQNNNRSNRIFDIKSEAEIIVPYEMKNGDVKMSAFFDLNEDGNLDILAEYDYHGDTKYDFIKCNDKDDTTFLKIQVFTNVCTSKCKPALGTELGKKNEKGSGVSWHGACSSFLTSDSWGYERLSSQCQIPQTSHRAMYSPYILFGLGRSPNFINELNFGAPRPVDPKRQPKISDYQRHQIFQIVPNSRIIVIPPKKEITWLTRLYLTPSSLIIRSIFVLLIVCGLLLMVVTILHMREKHNGMKERQAMSQISF